MADLIRLQHYFNSKSEKEKNQSIYNVFRSTMLTGLYRTRIEEKK